MSPLLITTTVDGTITEVDGTGVVAGSGTVWRGSVDDPKTSVGLYGSQWTVGAWTLGPVGPSTTIGHTSPDSRGLRKDTRE